MIATKLHILLLYLHRTGTHEWLHEFVRVMRFTLEIYLEIIEVLPTLLNFMCYLSLNGFQDEFDILTANLVSITLHSTTLINWDSDSCVPVLCKYIQQENT